MKIKDIPYINQIEIAAERWGIDPLMVAAIVECESAFNPNALSRVGAKGLMQLMPKTDIWLDGDTDGYNPDGNLDNGCRMLDWLTKYWRKKYPVLNNDHGIDFWRLVWAGYNAGPGNMSRTINLALKEVKSEAFSFDVWRIYLPQITGNSSKETINYVIKIEKAWKKYKKIKEKENSTSKNGSVQASKKRLECMLMVVNSLKKEIEQLLDESSVK